MESDQQLVAAAKRDKTQFVNLYDKYFDQIYKYMLTRVSDVQLAEDLTSQTFLIALEKIDTYEYMGKPFSAWLYRISINEMNLYFRKSKKEQDVSIKNWHETESGFEPADAGLKGSENEIDHLEKLKVLNSAMRQMEEDDQDILSLKYFEELSYQEIADVLGITVSNVGAKLNRATAKLAKACNF